MLIYKQAKGSLAERCAWVSGRTISTRSPSPSQPPASGPSPNLSGHLIKTEMSTVNGTGSLAGKPC